MSDGMETSWFPSMWEHIPVICPVCGKEYSLITGQMHNQDGSERERVWCMDCHIKDAKTETAKRGTSSNKK